MDTSILEDLGLTNAEIKVYLALLELGTSTAGPIIKKTQLQNSVTHMTLQKLLGKGFISFIKKGKIKHYHSADPKTIIKFIDEKKERFQKILPELLAKQKIQENQEAEIFEGFKGFKNAVYKLMDGSKPGDEYLFFSFYTKNPENFKYIYTFYKDLDPVRIKKGLITKGIVPKKIGHEMKDRKGLQYLIVDFPIPTNISILNDKVILTPFEDKQISILINSRQLAQSFREFFYSIWNQYKT